MQTHRRGPLRHARDPKLGSRQIGQVKVPSVDAAEALSQAEQHGPALRDRRQRGANGAGRLAVMLGAAPLPVTAVLSPSGFTGAGTPAETVNTMSEGPSQGIASMIPMADSALPINTFRECYNGGWCPSMCSRWRS